MADFIRYYLLLNVALITLYSSCVVAEDLHFYIIAKSQADSNFKRVLDGCEQAARQHGDHCYLVGPKLQSQPRKQFSEIVKVLSLEQADGLAISVIDSALVSKAISDATIPIITFDSPLLLENDSTQSIIHIGYDDEYIGRELAKMLIKDFPNGGKLCIMTDSDANLARRVKGVRLGLSINQTNQKLTGENGWEELSRCPMLTDDDPIKVEHQINLIVKGLKPEAIVSVGHWPVYFGNVVEVLSQADINNMSSGKPYLYSAIGPMTDSYKQLMKSGYVRGYAEINFHQQGKLIYQLLRSKTLNIQLESPIMTGDVIITHSTDDQ